MPLCGSNFHYRVKFLLDNNLSPHLARALNELCKRETPAVEVFALRALFPADTKDVDWLGKLDSDWNVVSADNFRQSDAEREVIRKAGLNVFVLQRTWARQRYWQQAAQLVSWWPRVLAQAGTVTKSAYRVPWKAAGKFEQIRV